MRRRIGCMAIAVSWLLPGSAAAQRALAPDVFVDPVAGSLYTIALENWNSLDESILRYSARIDQRIAAALRTPLKDRILYRNETAVRAFWDRDYESVVQVLGTRSQYPGRSIAVREGDLDWLDDLPFDEPFEPGGDRLFFGLTDDDPDDFQSNADDEFWFAHPLAEGADSLYQFASGDTITLSLPDGRRLQTIQLDVLPREADVHRITGSLWIEPESGALVRAVYRLSRQFDAIRDIPDLQEEEEAGEFRFVPGLFKPWTFDLTMIAVDYALWDFRIWLPRSMRLEGEAAAGILKFPVSMDVAYRIESVTTADDAGQTETVDLTAPVGPDEGLREVHFESRAEAMAFIARLLSEDGDVAYEQMSRGEPAARGRDSHLLVPEDRSRVATSPELPPPIWEEADGFPSDEQLEEYVRDLAKLPAPPIQGVPWSLDWGWAREDLIRYNRVEGPAIGGRFDAELGGPYTLRTSGFFGFADLRPKARLDLERSTVLRRLTLGAYHEIRPTDANGGYLGFGNSLYAFFFGRDDGEYYRASGVDFRWAPPVGARESFEFRAYAERQESLDSQTSFALFRALDDGWDFRPNVRSDEIDEAGAELRLAPWWGGDALGTQVGLELYGQGATWRITDDPPQDVSDRGDYARASAILRLAVPLGSERWRLGVEAGGGTSWGDVPAQRAWFLGSARTLRGYPASVVAGTSFTRGRMELVRAFDGIGSVSLFGDAGWAGPRDAFDADDFLYGVGLGGSLLDGLLRIDLSHGLNGPGKQFRIDLYLDALL